MAQCVQIYPLPAFNDNYIWCLRQSNLPELVVVDPGDAKVVLQHLALEALQLKAILVTHHHYDHTNGIDLLQQQCGPIPVFGPASSPCNGINQPLEHTQNLPLLDLSLQVIRVPGHTLDHIAYYAEKDEFLLCGDTLFMAGCGRIFEGTPAQLQASLTTLAQLPGTVKIYPTHEYTLANLAFAQTVEPSNQMLATVLQQCQVLRHSGQPTLPSTIQQELAINPFLRLDSTEVMQQASNYAAKHLDIIVNDNMSCFIALRQWKNNF
jgi:hydroxyacylglutathione hydrolase